MAAVQPLSSQGQPLPPLEIDYTPAQAGAMPAHDSVLAMIGFGGTQVPFGRDDPRGLTVPLASLGTDPAPIEYWRVDGNVQAGREGELAWSAGGGYLFVALRVEETRHGGIDAAARHAYRRLLDALDRFGHPHPLRIWNYLADINQGAGDDERYRRFTAGRAEGIERMSCETFPAATAIGRTDGVRELLVYALASKRPGRPIENPRQVSAYRYPRQYGPVPPSFARAMRIDTPGSSLLLLSGTASVVGHLSLHEQADLQADETLRNVETLLLAARDGADARLGARSRLKAYVRHRDHADSVRAALQERGIGAEQFIVLQGDICRAELLLEIDGVIRL